MLWYIYDGSFPGLLTAVYDAYYNKDAPERILAAGQFQPELLVKEVVVITDELKADKVYNAIKDKISARALTNVFYVYLSESADAGTLIYRYLRLGFKMGGQIDAHLTDDRVNQVYQLRNKVSGERHRMLGLLRFRKLENGIYYAPFEPDYNIIALTAPHFAKRLAAQNWLIHDVSRDLAAAYNTQEWVITELHQETDLSFGEDEIDYQALWKQYFQSTTIKHRINPKLQKRLMPERYWRHLVEK